MNKIILLLGVFLLAGCVSAGFWGKYWGFPINLSDVRDKKVSRITSKAPSVLIWFRNRGLIVSLNVSLNNFLFSNFQYFAGDVDSDQDGLTDAVDDDDDNDGIPDNREYLQNILLLASPSTSVTFLLNIWIKEKMDKTGKEWKLLDV